MLAKEVDCEQEYLPHSSHRRFLREVEYVNFPVFDKDGDPKHLSYLNF